MRNPRAKKPFSTLAQRLKEIRKQPLTETQIEKLNKVFDEMGKNKKAEPEVQEPKKRIARSPEAET